MVEDEGKRVTLRSALDDLLAGNLRVSMGEARLKSSGSFVKVNHKVRSEHARGSVSAMGLKRELHLIFKTLEDIGTKLTADVLERQGGRNVKTRLDAVDLHKPKTTCSIL